MKPATAREETSVYRMTAVMERWIGGWHRELLDRGLIWNLPNLRRILRDYETQHNEHRPHIWHWPVPHRMSHSRPKSLISTPSATENMTGSAVSSTNVAKQRDLCRRQFRQAHDPAG